MLKVNDRVEWRKMERQGVVVRLGVGEFAGMALVALTGTFGQVMNIWIIDDELIVID